MITFFDRLVTDEGERRPYREKITTGNIHWGQRKLLMSEIEFFTNYWNPIEVPEPIVLYVGAASGVHINILLKMFTPFKWILYDPGSFDPELMKNSVIDPTELDFNDKRSIIYQSLFTNDNVEFYKSLRDRLFFISDIRRNLVGMSGKEKEQAIIEDMKIQREWVETIDPIRSILKFRLPYVEKWTRDYGYRYLDGFVYKQVWHGSKSTECRLVPNKPYREKIYDFKNHEQQMFYYNTIVRNRTPMVVPIASLTQGELSTDTDSAIEYFILRRFLEKFNQFTDENVAKLVLYITKELHGHNLRYRRNNPEEEEIGSPMDID